MKVGSKLIAVFQTNDDMQAVLEKVRQLVVGALRRGSAVLKVARGSVVVHITFKVASAKIDKLISNLLLNGEHLSYTQDGQSNFMKAVGGGEHHAAFVHHY